MRIAPILAALLCSAPPAHAAPADVDAVEVRE